MKKTYEQPVVEDLATELECEVLVGSNIGEGGEGQEGDARDFGLEYGGVDVDGNADPETRALLFQLINFDF